MKKIFTTIIALVLCCSLSWAEATISLNPSTVDFGTVSLSEGSAEGSVAIQITHTDLPDYTGVFYEFEEEPAENAIFDIESDYISSEGTIYPWVTYDYQNYELLESSELRVTYLAEAPGTYSGKVIFYTYTEDWNDFTEPVYLDIKLAVTNEATAVDQTAVKVKARKYVQDGQLVIEKNGALYNVLGTKL